MTKAFIILFILGYVVLKIRERRIMKKRFKIIEASIQLDKALIIEYTEKHKEKSENSIIENDKIPYSF
jgi:hypothetical protein